MNMYLCKKLPGRSLFNNTNKRINVKQNVRRSDNIIWYATRASATPGASRLRGELEFDSRGAFYDLLRLGIAIYTQLPRYIKCLQERNTVRITLNAFVRCVYV